MIVPYICDVGKERWSDGERHSKKLNQIKKTYYSSNMICAICEKKVVTNNIELLIKT